MSGAAPGAAGALAEGRVHGQEDILRERLARDLCSACGAARRREDILILAHRSSRWLALVACWQCHHRGIFIATFPHDDVSPKTERLSLTPHHPLLDPALDTRLPAAPIPSVKPLPLPDAGDSPITLSDVDAMRRFLSGFNGDFQSLFGGEAQ